MVVHNPNNWHYVEKNCIDWTRQYFKDNLTNVEAESDDKVQNVHISNVTSIEGDSVVSQKRGKVSTLFDLKLVLAYTGNINDLEVKGSITIPEIAYDSEEDDYQFQISVFSEDSKNSAIKEVIRQKLIPKLRKIFLQFGKDLISTHASDIQLPADQVKSELTKANQVKSSSSSNLPATSESSKQTSTGSSSSSKTTSTSSSSNVPKYNTSTLHLEPVFNTTAEQLFITFLEKNRVGAWTRANPDFNGDFLKENANFNLFGGNVSGKITKLIPNESIEQEWRLNSWKSGHFAKLIIGFHQGDSETKLDVLFKGIPIGEEDQVRGNFEDYYIKAIKLTFGFGAVL
ncbi:hypothetical protein BN7_6336 [Wickerhamomyces ciferrii]|uniref:Activator of Hsp90 ATPase AHSA1-like N-terminal domain-containing protein n=1 Tax=Wickerhamomyces ciferrii (strain ATCC 14091 / BCRC 22168 / CBS 111 / JCM 3599 / NBRC 0793 / NRRL Y-1031 F-60-10) TaxID=1206466 RepID=K0L023_WICCF|nr:uncharacterized protein BN7_6336 [Wickerhamomyces ciferrii]CCH46738.1 hypothetical protein BN7_6336 [Wickerhamomyces ciferrii]